MKKKRVLLYIAVAVATLAVAEGVDLLNDAGSKHPFGPVGLVVALIIGAAVWTLFILAPLESRREMRDYQALRQQQGGRRLRIKARHY